MRFFRNSVEEGFGRVFDGVGGDWEWASKGNVTRKENMSRTEE